MHEIDWYVSCLHWFVESIVLRAKHFVVKFMYMYLHSTGTVNPLLSPPGACLF